MLLFRNFFYIFWGTILLTFCACSGSDEPQVLPIDGDSQPIVFVCDEHAESRALLQTVNTAFDVWAWKTDASSNEQAVMRHVDGTPFCVDFVPASIAWNYDGIYGQTLRFWDPSAHDYRFTAYSPRLTDGMTASLDADHHLTLAGVKGHTDAVADWLIAQFGRRLGSDMFDIDLLEPTVYAPIASVSQVVPLNFHHIQAKVEYKAYLVNPTDKKITSITLSSASTPLYTVGTYSEGDAWADGTANWTVKAGSGTPTFMHAENADGINLTSAHNKATAVSLVSYVEIPQQFPADGLKLTATIVTADKTITAPVTLTGAWETNKYYVYYFAIDLEKAVILVDIDVDSFKWNEGNDINPDPVTNW